MTKYAYDRLDMNTIAQCRSSCIISHNRIEFFLIRSRFRKSNFRLHASVQILVLTLNYISLCKIQIKYASIINLLRSWTDQRG